MGYKFQFVTLAGFHALNYSMFELARGYQASGMTAYAELQEREMVAERNGYTATRHQREVGTAYFDDVAQVIAGGDSSTLALEESTERQQFEPRLPAKHDFLDRLEANYAGDGISHDPDRGATALSRGR